MMRKKVKELMKDTSIYGMTTVISRLVGFILLPLYTHYLTPKDYGIIAMLGLFQSVFLPLGNLGLKSAVFRYISKAETAEEESMVFSTVYFSSLVITLVVGLLCLLFAKPLTLLLLDEAAYLNIFLITLATAALSSLSTIFSAFLRIKRAVWKASIGGLLNLIISVFASIILVVYFHTGVLGTVIGAFVGCLSMQLYFFFAVHAPSIKLFNLQELKVMLRYSLPFLPHQLQAVGLALFAQFMLKEMMSLEDAGLYNIAWKFCLPLNMAIEAFQTSWGAYKFEIYKKDANAKQTFSSFFSIYFITTCTLYLATALFGWFFLKLTIHYNFHAAHHLIPVLALIPLFNGAYYMMGSGIGFGDKPKRLPAISLIGLIIIIAVSYLLIPPLLAIGAGIANAIGWAVMSALVFMYGQSIYKIPINWKIPILLMAEVLLLIILSYGTVNTLSSNIYTCILAFMLFTGTNIVFLLKTKKGSEIFDKFLLRFKNTQPN